MGSARGKILWRAAVRRSLLTVGALFVVLATSTPATSPARAAAFNVDVSSFQFTPSSITVTAGDTITWTLVSGTHTTCTGQSGNCDGDSNGWSSGSLGSIGGSFNHTLNNVGVFQYTCDFHPSMNATVTVQASLPAPPTSLTAVDTPGDQGGSVDLAWTPSATAGVTEQRLYRGTTSGSYPTLVTTTATSTSAYTDSGLTDGTTYYYVVRAFDGTAESGDSNEDSAVPADNTAPQPPTNLTALDRPTDQGGAVIIAWVLSTSTDVTQQHLFRATSPGGPYTEFANFDENATFYIDTGLTDGTTYYYVIRSFDGTSESADSNEDSAAPLDNIAPQPPSTSTDVTELRVFRSVTSTGPYTLVATTTSSTYFYVVRAFDGASESGDSNEDSVVPVDDPLLAPTGLTAADRPGDQGGEIDIAWTPSTSLDATEQRLYRSVTSTGPYSLVATTTSSTTAYTDSGLTDGTTYYYVVRAFDGATESPTPTRTRRPRWTTWCLWRPPA